jgi:predicted nucleic acid-binding protein
VPGVASTIEQADTVHLPFVALAELRACFAGGVRGRENEQILQRFLRKPGVSVLLPTEATTNSYAALHRQLREQRTPIPTHDLWIAALVVEHGITLFSRDAHFDHLPQIHRV